MDNTLKHYTHVWEIIGANGEMIGNCQLVNTGAGYPPMEDVLAAAGLSPVTGISVVYSGNPINEIMVFQGANGLPLAHLARTN